MTNYNRTLHAALAYPECFKFFVFAIRPWGKEPLTEHGCNDATIDVAVIGMCWNSLLRQTSAYRGCGDHDHYVPQTTVS